MQIERQFASVASRGGSKRGGRGALRGKNMPVDRGDLPSFAAARAWEGAPNGAQEDFLAGEREGEHVRRACETAR